MYQFIRQRWLGWLPFMAVGSLIVLHSGSAKGREPTVGPFVIPSPDELTTAATGFKPEPYRPPTTANEPLAARLEDLAKQIPATRYDLKAGAEAMPGLDAVFAFVRDEVRFEAYSGVLRGAELTYVNRAGNASDRSLLLAEILKLQGVKTRFALGHLPRPEAERLLAHIFEPSPSTPSEVDSGAEPRTARAADSFESRIRSRAVHDWAVIRAALNDDLPAYGSPTPDQVLSEIENHVWLQAQVNGKWVDLDASFADAEPGTAYCKAQRTAEKLPKNAFQQVAVRVVIETLAGDELKSKTVLNVVKPVAELLDRQIFLVHGSPVSGGPAGGLTAAIAGAGGGEVWVPLLWIDGEFSPGEPVTYTEGAKKPERGTRPTGGLGGLFGPSGALGTSQQFVAEWLEFEIQFPDGRRDVTRRALVDRASLAWRQAKTHDPQALQPLPRDRDGLTTPREVHNLWFSAGRHNLSQYLDALRLFVEATHHEGEGTAASKLSFGEQVWPLALQGLAMLIVSDHLIVPSLNDLPECHFYADSPRIHIISMGPAPGIKGAKDTAGFFLLDLRRDHLRGLAREPSAEAGVVERRMWFGLLEGAFEHEVVAPYAVALDESAPVVSTSSLLGVEGATVLRPSDQTLVSQLAANEKTTQRINSALSAGNTVAVPKPATTAGLRGWWEIGPDGQTRAVLSDEFHGSYLGPFNIPGAGRINITEPIGPKIRPWGPGGLVDNPNYPRGGEDAKKKGGGPEYPAMIKLATEGIVAAAVGYVGAYAWDWGVKLGERLYDYVTSAANVP